MNAKRLNTAAWTISLLSVLLAKVVWWESLDWQLNFDSFGVYNLFPLLGLVAFSLMWAHYISGVLRRYYGFDKEVLSKYFKCTGIVVLVCILLHPHLLMLQLYLDGFGLPPQSYLENYVAPTLAWAVGLGTISLFIFLLFELHHKFSQKKWWKFIDYAQILAMVFILLHSLALGKHLQSGWYRYVWISYGISFIVAVIYIYGFDKIKEKT